MKIRVLIFTLLILCESYFALPAQARSVRRDTIDKRLYEYAMRTPPYIARDIDKLVNYLERPAASKKDVAKTFAYWIMQNISYDISGFMTGRYNKEGVTGTLRDKRGVCEDYSELFKAMCDRAGIKCYVVPGYAKAFNYITGTRFDKANHSWNVVWLDNAYVLLDLTWSSGHVEYKDNAWRYFIEPDLSQSFAAPETFIAKHMPSDPKWQLLYHPVSMGAFMRFSDPKEMLQNAGKYYNFRDSIGRFEQMNEEEQELQSAEAAYRFYPLMSEYAYHYYNQAVNYSNTATDYYNAAVNSYNKSVEKHGTAVASGNYNKTSVSTAVNYYAKAIKLLARIRNYNDNDINAGQLLEKCTMGLDASNEMLKTLR